MFATGTHKELERQCVLCWKVLFHQSCQPIQKNCIAIPIPILCKKMYRDTDTDTRYEKCIAIPIPILRVEKVSRYRYRYYKFKMYRDTNTPNWKYIAIPIPILRMENVSRYRYRYLKNVSRYFCDTFPKKRQKWLNVKSYIYILLIGCFFFYLKLRRGHFDRFEQKNE